MVLLTFNNCSNLSDAITKEEFKKVDCNIKALLVNNLCEDEFEYFIQAKKYKIPQSIHEISEEYLKQITYENLDIDIATALFYSSLIEDPKNRVFINNVLKQEKIYLNKKFNFSNIKLKFLIIPGMFYVDNPDAQSNGEAFAKFLSKIGISSEIIKVGQTSHAAINGEFICNYIKNNTKSDIQYIIFSTSKGSKDFLYAIKNCHNDLNFKRIKSWINMGGIVNGSYLLEKLEKNQFEYWENRLYFLLNGYSWEGIESLRRSSFRNIVSENELNKLKIFSIIGVPFFRNVSNRAKNYYLNLNPNGPNDGYVMLTDSILPNSYVYPSLRNDHYFQFEFSESRFYGILGEVIKLSNYK